MGPISTHVLDTSTGKPIVGLSVALHHVGGESVGHGITDTHGRIAELAPAGPLAQGTYELVFDTGAWFEARAVATLYPSIRIQFRIDPIRQADLAGEPPGLHLPLLLSPFGYTTYRGH